jgi:SAM-dependent methyltransferase
MEFDRINEVYLKRKDKKNLYRCNVSSYQYGELQRKHMMAQCLFNTFGSSIESLAALDVGCGKGGFLRELLEYRAQAENLFGTEFLQDRIDVARKLVKNNHFIAEFLTTLFPFPKVYFVYMVKKDG